MNQTIEMCFLVFMVGIFLAVLFCAFMYIRYTSNIYKIIGRAMDEYVHYRSFNIYSRVKFKEVDEYIDSLVNEGLDQYKILNVSYLEQEKVYINKNKMEEIIKYVTQYVLKRITPNVETLLSTYINLEDEKDMFIYITDKVKLATLKFSIEVNSDNYQN